MENEIYKNYFTRLKGSYTTNKEEQDILNKGMKNKVDYPGISLTSFKIVFKEDFFTKGSVINKSFKVIKVLDRVWWRRLLIWLKFIQPTNTIVVKEV